MTPHRRAQILRHVPTIGCAEELAEFEAGLAQGERTDTEVFRALRGRESEIYGQAERAKRR